MSDLLESNPFNKLFDGPNPNQANPILALTSVGYLYYVC